MTNHMTFSQSDHVYTFGHMIENYNYHLMHARIYLFRFNTLVFKNHFFNQYNLYLVLYSVVNNFADNESTMLSQPPVNITCSDQFYFDESSQVCKPECGVWTQHSHLAANLIKSLLLEM